MQRAVLHVLHVVDPYVPELDHAPASGFGEAQAAMCRRGDALLARACLAAGTHGVSAEPVLRTIARQSVAETIVAQAQGSGCGCDLIVMGTHGRSGLSRMLIGSVAENVVRASTTPVLLVPPARAVEARYG